jgi:hypothetical protein
VVALGFSAFKNISRCFFGDLAAISKWVFERSISPKYSTEEREISLSRSFIGRANFDEIFLFYQPV